MRVGARVPVLFLIASTFAFAGCPKEEKKDEKASTEKSAKSSKDDEKKKSDDDDDDEPAAKKKKKKTGDDDDDDEPAAKKKKKTGDDDDDDEPAAKKKKTGDDDDDDDEPTAGKKGGADDPPAASENLFAGKYSSNWGTTVFKQDGTKVTGTYPLGTLSCTVIKEVSIACQWFEGSSTGRAFMTRNATSGVLSGAWGSGTSSNNGGSWTFTPIK